MSNSDLDPANRALTGNQYQDGTKMTIETCLAFCESYAYNYGMIEYGDECCKCCSRIQKCDPFVDMN